jgi:hypothetical protein
MFLFEIENQLIPCVFKVYFFEKYLSFILFLFELNNNPKLFGYASNISKLSSYGLLLCSAGGVLAAVLKL